MIRYLIIFQLFFGIATAEVLSIEQAIQKALNSHPDIKIGALNLERSVSETKAVNADLLPLLSLNASYYPSKTIVLPQNGVFATRQIDTFHTDITAKYMLWDGGSSNARKQAAQINENIFSYKKEENAEELTEQVKQVYYTIDYLRNRIRAAKASVAFYDVQLKRAIAMHRSGLKTEADESRFRASWFSSLETLQTLESDMQKKLHLLSLLTGVDSGLEIVEGVLQSRFQSIPETVEIETLRTQLLEKNPRLNALSKTIESAKVGINAAEGIRYGTLDAIAQYGWDQSLSTYDSSFVGLIGTVPLYDGNKQSAYVQKAKLEHALAVEEYERNSRLLWQSLYEAAQDMVRSEHLFETQSAINESMQKTLKLMEGRYTQGLASYVDVLEAQSLYEQSQSGIYEAKLLKVLAWERIEKLLNRGSTRHE